MPASDLTCTDWLGYRWPMTIEQRQLGCDTSFAVIAGGVTVSWHKSLPAAQAWMTDARPSCLAELIATHRTLHPALVTITSAGTRIGRVRPELWGSYDAFKVLGTHDWMTALSAKARAAFSNHANVLVQVVRVR